MFLPVDVVHDGGQHRRLDLPHLSSTVLLANDLVEPAQTSSQSGVEVVFYVVVGSGWEDTYRPIKCFDMSFQRLP